MSSFVFQRGNSVDRDSSAREGGREGGNSYFFLYPKSFLKHKTSIDHNFILKYV